MDENIKNYLAEIGSRGGKSRAARHSKAQLKAWAKLGGRPRKDKAKSKAKDRGRTA